MYAHTPPPSPHKKSRLQAGVSGGGILLVFLDWAFINYFFVPDIM